LKLSISEASEAYIPFPNRSVEIATCELVVEDKTQVAIGNAVNRVGSRIEKDKTSCAT
jgi:hypothetical protein